MSGREYRSAAAMVAGTTATLSGVTVGGVGIPYDSDSRPLPWIESFAPGAFRDQATGDGFEGVTGQFMHDATLVVASVDSGTMQVVDGPLGLRYTMRVPASLGYVRELVESGVTAGASIGFQVVDDQWSVDPDGTPRRLVTRAVLAEISIVARPAYPRATAAVTGGPQPLRSRRVPAETREGKVISASTHAALSAVHDNIAAALLQLRDLMDVAKFEEPADGGFGESASIGGGLAEAPDGSQIGPAIARQRVRVSPYATSTLTVRDAAKLLGRRQARQRCERVREAELALRQAVVDFELVP